MQILKKSRCTISFLAYLILVSSFTITNADGPEYNKLLKLEKRALQHTPGRTYEYDLTGRKYCNKTRILYLGTIQTKNGKRYKILTSFFVFSASSTCHGASSIKIFDIKNRYVGEYPVGMPYDLPDILRNNKLFYVKSAADCNRRKGSFINLGNGLPKSFFIPCSKNGGDFYSFSSGN